MKGRVKRAQAGTLSWPRGSRLNTRCTLSRQSALTAPLRVDALQAKADAIRATQLETQRELDALMLAVLDRAVRGEL